MPLMLTNRPHSRDAGFTLIEVIIAMVILAMVVGASASAIAVSTHSSTKTKIISRQREVANAVLHRATANTSWIKTYNCGVGVCSGAVNAYVPANDPLLDEPDGTVTHRVSFTATGIDRADDGVGAADGDQVIPDAFRLEVSDAISATGVVAVPPPVFTASNVLDMAVRGSTGTVRIQTCKVYPQIDERLGTGLCRASGPSTFNITPTTPCPATRFECGAWAAAAPTPNYSRVTVAPFPGVHLVINGPLPGAATTHDVTTDASGTGFIRDLAPGQYRITSTTPPGGDPYWSTWKTHSVPSGDYITVEAGTIHDATELLKPKVAAPVTVDVNTQDITDPLTFVNYTTAKSRVTVKLIPIPNGRANLSRGPNEGYTVIPVGADRVALVGAEPGLYALQMLHYPGSTVSKLSAPGSRYVWIPPGYQGSATVPASLIYLQQYCNAAARHARVLALCPSWQQFCWGVGNKLIADCQDDTTYTPTAAAGDGGA
ncbi:MAG: prepilin-type N-terminal cleavage/methylation domain-containing protein [Thermoleophilia bacterium]|nr:prepilin-type N-terminal cleavage/methylation domain-containing protein [Thermoleophilia bacterium]